MVRTDRIWATARGGVHWRDLLKMFLSEEERVDWQWSNVLLDCRVCLDTDRHGGPIILFTIAYIV